MRDLHKRRQISIRFSRTERREIEQVARLVSRQRGQVVAPSALFREVGLTGIRALRAQVQDEAAA